MRVFITYQNKTHKKLVATVKRCEGVYNRTGEPSVTFLHKKVEAKRTLLRRGAPSNVESEHKAEFSISSKVIVSVPSL